MTAIPSTTWRMLAQRRTGKELPTGIDAAWDAAVGWAGRLARRRRTLMRRAERIAERSKAHRDTAEARLKEQARSFRERFRRGRQKPHDVDNALALLREVAFRQLGERPHVNQIAGALGMYRGYVVEMATGEGKTLTATMPATLAGWAGRGCHVITVNDYLARRDAEWMTRIYGFCGLSVAHVEGEMPPPDRKAAYQADITYCTKNEATADFLRDRLALGRTRDLPGALLARIVDGHGSGTDRLVQRGLHHAIVDEADSVLIDEAVTPLIISGSAPNSEQVEAFAAASEAADRLEPDRDFKVNPRYREIDLTPAGRRRVEELTAHRGGVWSGARRREELIVQALTARQFYQQGKQYVIEDGKIVIVDEFTGRLMPDRTWRDGLHQAIEAKDGVEVNPVKDTLARVSFQRFFRLYRRLAGMTGTAVEARGEFWSIYHLPVVALPTNRPSKRVMQPDRVYASEQAKFAGVMEEIQQVHQQGRPVLVGTRSVRISLVLSDLLTAAGLDHQVLNAVNEASEAQIIAAAGSAGRITVATNMAGRGTNIRLGKGVHERGGLHVIATERHESARIDRQLFGRCARQGQNGSARAHVSFQDELIQRHCTGLSRTLAGRLARREGELSSPLTRRLWRHAQARAEHLAYQQRRAVLKTDDWLDEHLGFAGSE